MRLRLVDMREATRDEKAELKRAIEARNVSEVSKPSTWQVDGLALKNKNSGLPVRIN